MHGVATGEALAGSAGVGARGEGRWTAAQARAALAAGTVVTLAGMVRTGAILVVAPHPDDETLGCGGLIALAADAGRQVVVACLTDGAASHPGSGDWPPTRLAALRGDELAEAVTILAGDAARVETFGARDGRLETCEPSASDWLTQVAAEGSCGAVFTTWVADPHPDHKAAFRIAACTAAALGVPLFAYPIWGLILADGEDAGPVGTCHRLDISQMLTRKRAAIAAFRSQTTPLIRDDPGGFRLRSDDLERHLRLHEHFIRVRM